LGRTSERQRLESAQARKQKGGIVSLSKNRELELSKELQNQIYLLLVEALTQRSHTAIADDVSVVLAHFLSLCFPSDETVFLAALDARAKKILADAKHGYALRPELEDDYKIQ
jgi:hypothetical protein